MKTHGIADIDISVVDTMEKPFEVIGRNVGSAASADNHESRLLVFGGSGIYYNRAEDKCQ